jgi:hypothetical protein
MRSDPKKQPQVIFCRLPAAIIVLSAAKGRKGRKLVFDTDYTD